MKSYLYGLAANYLHLLLHSLISLCLIPILLHLVGTQATGVYLFLMMLSNFAAVGIGWFSGPATTTLAASDGSDQIEDRKLIHHALTFCFVSYATLFFILISIASLWVGELWLVDASHSLVEQAKISCLLLGVLLWITYLHNADLTLLTATLRQGEANMLRAVSQVIFGLAAFSFVFSYPRIDLLILARIISIVVPTIVLRFRLLRSQEIVTFQIPSQALIKKVFVDLGKQYFFFSATRQIMSYLDVLVVGLVLGAEAVSLYVIVWKIAEFSALLINRISDLLIPYFARLKGREASGDLTALFLTTSRIQTWIALLAAGIYAIYGSTLVQLWVGVEAAPKEQWLYMLAGANIFFAVVNGHDMIIHYSLGAVRHLIVPQCLESIFRIAAILLLHPYFAFGTPILAQAAVQILFFTWWYRRLALRLIESTWSTWAREVAAPALCAIAFGALLILIAPPLNFGETTTDQLNLAILAQVLVTTGVTSICSLIALIAFERVSRIRSILEVRTIIRSA